MVATQKHVHLICYLIMIARDTDVSTYIMASPGNQERASSLRKRRSRYSIGSGQSPFDHKQESNLRGPQGGKSPELDLL